MTCFPRSSEGSTFSHLAIQVPDVVATSSNQGTLGKLGWSSIQRHHYVTMKDLVPRGDSWVQDSCICLGASPHQKWTSIGNRRSSCFGAGSTLREQDINIWPWFSSVLCPSAFYLDMFLLVHCLSCHYLGDIGSAKSALVYLLPKRDLSPNQCSSMISQERDLAERRCQTPHSKLSKAAPCTLGSELGSHSWEVRILDEEEVCYRGLHEPISTCLSSALPLDAHLKKCQGGRHLNGGS